MKIKLSEKEEYTLEYFRQISSYVFQALLLLFLIALLAREFYPAFIDSRININWFMIVVIIFGALSILFPPNYKKPKEEKKSPALKEFALIVVLGILGAVILILKLKSLGWIGYAISIIGGLIIILLSWLLLAEKDEEEKTITEAEGIHQENLTSLAA